MKKSVIAIVALSSLALAGCGSSEKKEAKEERVDSVAKTAPMEAERKLERSYTAKYGEHTYSISIKRYPNHELPIVKDQLDQEFYDNSVEIVILRDGKSFFEKTSVRKRFLITSVRRTGRAVFCSEWLLMKKSQTAVKSALQPRLGSRDREKVPHLRLKCQPQAPFAVS